MEMFTYGFVGLFLAGLLIRWLFPNAAPVLGWIVLVITVPLTLYLLHLGITFFKASEGSLAMLAIFIAWVVGCGGVALGGALVWGPKA